MMSFDNNRPLLNHVIL